MRWFATLLERIKKQPPANQGLRCVLDQRSVKLPRRVQNLYITENLALMPSPVWQQATQEWLQGNLGAATAGIGLLMLAVTLASCAWSLDEG